MSPAIPAGGLAEVGQRVPDGVVRWYRDGVGDALGFPGAVAISGLAWRRRRKPQVARGEGGEEALGSDYGRARDGATVRR
jgi:hypothetical protein